MYKHSAEPSIFHFFGLLLAVVAAYAMMLTAFGPLAAVRIDFLILEGVSVNDLAGPWSVVVRHTLAAIVASCAGWSYVVSVRRWRLSFVAAFPLSVLFGIVGLIAVLCILTIAFVIVFIVGILVGLFFSPGDR